jgi:hypothetical protein
VKRPAATQAHAIAKARRRAIVERCARLYPDIANNGPLITWRNHGREFSPGWAVHACCVGFEDGAGRRRVLLVDDTWAKLFRAVQRIPLPPAT